MIKGEIQWGTPAADAVMRRLSEQHYRAGVFALYATKLAKEELMLSHFARENCAITKTGGEEGAVDVISGMLSDLRYNKRAELPLVPRYESRGNKEHINLGKVDTGTGIVTPSSVVFAGTKRLENYYWVDKITQSQARLLLDQVEELDSLGLEPIFPS